MSDKSTGSSSPINNGNTAKIYISIDGQNQVIDNLLYISILDGDVTFKKSQNLVFSLIQNEDILSIIPKREIRINKEVVQPGSMYILDTKDIIYYEEKHFTLEVEDKVKIKELDLNIHAKNNFPPDITQEIKVSSFKNRMITPELPDIAEEMIKKSFFSRFKKLKSTEPKIQKEEDFDTPRSANAVVRVIAIALDFLTSATLLEFITIDKALLELINTSSIDLNKYHLDLASIYYVASLFIVFYTLRVISSFIFGTSFGQMLCGLYTEDGVLVKRIKGGFREIIGIFTSAIILLDLPCLIGKRTLKEFLTGSRIQASGFIKTFILCLLSGAILFSVWVSAPIFSSDTELNHVNVDVTVLKRKVPQLELKVQESKFFNFSIDSNSIVLPEFLFKRVGAKVIGQPSIKIYNNDSRGEVSFIKEVDLRKILDNLKTNNFVIKSFYPSLANVLFDKRKNSLDLDSIKDIMMATDVAYSLNIESIFDHILNKGPFVTSYLSYRTQMDQVIDSAFINISYQNIANYPYLNFERTKSSSRLLALSMAKANIIDISSRDKSFVKSLLPINTNSKPTLSLLSLIDIFYNKDFSDLNLKKSFMISYDFLKKATNEELTVSKDEILKSYESQVKYLGTIKRTIKDKNTVELINKYIQNISDLIRAYKENDSSYFSRNRSSIEEKAAKRDDESEQIDLDPTDKENPSQDTIEPEVTIPVGSREDQELDANSNADIEEIDNE